MNININLMPEEYRVGHKYIDGQHEILFQLFEELSLYCKNSEAEVELEFILLSLKTYVETHFRFEEGLMEQVAGYKDIVAHKGKHKAFEQLILDKMATFDQLSQEDELKSFAKELRDFLQDWLIEHIAKTDRQFCQTINYS
jgi:hemerythrin